MSTVADNERDLRPMEELLARVVGREASRAFSLELVGDPDGEWFEIEASDGRVVIVANSISGFGPAIRHYLVHACGVDVSWDRSSPLRNLELRNFHSGRIEARFTLRYAMNYCTFGYTTAYWQWEEWEREIDWMALHGVNLPLNIVGYEAIWWRVLARHGMTDSEIGAYLGAGAFLPWLWMGCVHSHGSPMTRQWADSHLELGRRIVDRQRDLGMRVVQPAFAGFIPTRIAPSRTSVIEWFGFKNAQLSPSDPLFGNLAAEILNEATAAFGSDHFFALDPFIEGRPPYDVPNGLGAVSSALAASLIEHDPNAIWVMQAWPFEYAADYWTEQHIEAFLGSIPAGHLLVLDLWAEHRPLAEKTFWFHGHPWVWCMLNNFGGRSGSHGALPSIELLGSVDARGVGVTMEALDRNPLIFEALADAMWTDRWSLRDLAAARYGSRDPDLLNAVEAWRRVSFERTSIAHPPKSVVVARPSCAGDAWPMLENTRSEYVSDGQQANLEAVFAAMIEFVLSNRIVPTPGLKRDIAELGLEVLSGRAFAVFRGMIESWKNKKTIAFDDSYARFARIIHLMDDLAGTDERTMLGTWLEKASSWAHVGYREADLRSDAKLLLTAWVAPGHFLSDYAGRHWSGLLRGYYLARWELWHSAMQEGIDRGAVNPAAFEGELSVLEQKWLDRDDRFSTMPAANTLEIAMRIVRGDG